MGTIAVNDRITPVFLAAPGQTDFAVDFAALKFNGAYAGLFCVVTHAGVQTELTLADFDVIAPTAAGFTARLHAGALGGDSYQFFGVFPAGRDIAWSGGAFSTETAEADMAQRMAQIQELWREVNHLLTSGGGGGGGGGGVDDDSGPIDWSRLTSIPATWPNGVSWGSISGRPAAWPGTLPWASLTAVAPQIAAIAALGAPANGQIVEFTGPATAHYIATPAGGGGGSGQQPNLLSAFGAIDGGGVNTAANDAAITAAEAAADSAIYLPDGIYATTKAENSLTKRYVGRGIFLFTAAANDALPANYSYMAAKPTTWPTQGRAGWFRGDQRFTDQWYRVIGPGVRSFDLAARYYESNVIPRNAWLDGFSGSSGSQAFLTAGAAAGATVIPLPAAADASWVGQTVAFNDSYGGAALETKTVLAVNTAGNNITINSPLANTYTWSPGTGHMPGIYFAPRTWGGQDYLKMTAAGGGDWYGHNVRTVINYVPKATEKHTFQAGTFSQYGGDVSANTDGVMMQCWESQLQAQGHEVGAIAFVQSFVRDVDHDLDGGRFWGGTWFQSTGARPADVAHGVNGFWRVGVDFANATLEETTRLTGVANATNVFSVASTNGAHFGDQLQIGAELLTITGIVAGTTVTTTAACIGNYGIGTVVTFPSGGAGLNMKLGQQTCWNASISANARGADPLGVFAPFYGNVQGDLIMRSGNDGTDFWSVAFKDGGSSATPDSGRIRLRRGGIQIFGTGQHTINGTALSLTSSCSLNMDISTGASKLTLGPGMWLQIIAGHIQGTIDSGAHFTILV